MQTPIPQLMSPVDEPPESEPLRSHCFTHVDYGSSKQVIHVDRPNMQWCDRQGMNVIAL